MSIHEYDIGLRITDKLESKKKGKKTNCVINIEYEVIFRSQNSKTYILLYIIYSIIYVIVTVYHISQKYD